jgi:hypothetical protein
VVRWVARGGVKGVPDYMHISQIYMIPNIVGAQLLITPCKCVISVGFSRLHFTR